MLSTCVILYIAPLFALPIQRSSVQPRYAFFYLLTLDSRDEACPTNIFHLLVIMYSISPLHRSCPTSIGIPHLTRTGKITEDLQKGGRTKQTLSCIAGGVVAISCLSTVAAAIPTPNSEEFQHDASYQESLNIPGRLIHRADKRQIIRGDGESSDTEIGPQLGHA